MMVAERSPVMLLQVRRMSCQHDGSKIEIHPPLEVDSKRATCPGFHLSLYAASAVLYLLGTCCSLCCCKTTFLSASVCLTLRVVYCVGEELRVLTHRFRGPQHSSTGQCGLNHSFFLTKESKNCGYDVCT